MPAEYRKKLSVLASNFSGTRSGKVGPCVARLERLRRILELVVGAFGEVSSDLDRAVTVLDESRVLYLSRESSKPFRRGGGVASWASTGNISQFFLSGCLPDIQARPPRLWRQPGSREKERPDVAGAQEQERSAGTLLGLYKRTRKREASSCHCWMS